MSLSNFNDDDGNETSTADKVHTVVDYWDGPREGIADYKGQPHYYKALFDEQADAWSNTFLLKPIDAETFRLALEAWNIWLKWEAAQHEGRVPLESHPALPEDRERYKELADLLAERLVVDPNQDLSLVGKFLPVNGDTRLRSSRKRWTVKWIPRLEIV
jgi:hypothetical protein